MDREIELSSSSVKSIPGNQPEHFVTKFTKPITLGSNFEYQLGLNRIINMSYTWFNVNQSYNNQTIAYSIKISLFQLVYGIIMILTAVSNK